MPELPEVESFKWYVDSTALHQQVSGVHVERDKVLKGTSVQGLAKRIHQCELKEVRRHGKNLFLLFGKTHEDTQWLLVHFGMSGYFCYYNNRPDDLKYDRLTFDFKDGYHLAFIDQRLFGKVEIIESPEQYINSMELGPDVLDITEAAFKKRLSDKKGMIKAALMNQSVVAGLGNIYVDELLFQSHIHPQTGVDELDEKQLTKMYRQMQVILKKMITVRTQHQKDPEGFLLAHRTSNGTCPQGCGKLKTIKIASRTTYYCPKCQEK